MDLEELRSLARDTINETMSLLLSDTVDRTRTVAEATDLFLYQKVAVRK